MKKVAVKKLQLSKETLRQIGNGTYDGPAPVTRPNSGFICC
jgi:hypothetical protein